MRYSWHKRVLSEYSRSTVASVSATLGVLMVLSVAQLLNGGVFEWEKIAPIDQPDILVRFLYSALTFVSIGAILYNLRFYQFLSLLFGSDRRGYREAKGIIWAGLILIMYFVIVPFVVEVMNTTVSFLYNIALLFLYVSPVVFVTFFAVTALAIYRRLYWQKVVGPLSRLE